MYLIQLCFCFTHLMDNSVEVRINGKIVYSGPLPGQQPAVTSMPVIPTPVTMRLTQTRDTCGGQGSEKRILHQGQYVSVKEALDDLPSYIQAFNHGSDDRWIEIFNGRWDVLFHGDNSIQDRSIKYADWFKQTAQYERIGKDWPAPC